MRLPSLRSAGVTLIELMIALSILGVLVSLAVPSMRAFIITQKVKATSFDLYSNFLLAQSEAVKRNAAVSITPISTDWSNGWIISTADPADASATLTIRRQESVAGVTVVDSRGTSPAAVIYARSGRTNAGGGFSLTVDASSETSVWGRCLNIKSSGTPITSLKPMGGTC